MAPEVLSKNYREKCDLWSAGVLLYFMLTAKLPFTASTQEALHSQIKRAQFTFPDKELSADSKSLIKCLLNPKTDERYSASQALDHPWFAANLAPRPASTFDFTQLTNYLKLEKMQKLVVAYIAAHTSDSNLLEQMKEFIKINTSRSGVLSKEEVDKWITGKNIGESSDEVFNAINLNKTKGLQYFGTFRYLR
jgi:serine/threonine protein kinase